jgi:hypothetical protein
VNTTFQVDIHTLQFFNPLCRLVRTAVLFLHQLLTEVSQFLHHLQVVVNSLHIFISFSLGVFIVSYLWIFVKRFQENIFLCFAQNFRLKKAGVWLFCTIPLASIMSERLKKIRRPPVEDTIGLVCGINASLPNAPAVLGSPAFGLANLCEVLGNSSAVFLGLGIFDFVEVHHLYHFLSFFVS